MKTAMKVVGSIIVLLIVSKLISFAFGLMNQPSDFAVAGGLGILLVLLFAAITLGVYFYKKYTKKDSGDIVKKIITVFLVFFALSATSGCTRVGPGHVGIKINMSGDNRGVDELPLETGWVFYNFLTQSVFEYPTYVQTAVWTKNENEGSPMNEEVSFNSKEGLIITGDISLSYSLQAKKVPHFYVKFRSDDLNVFTHGFLRNIARDVFNEVSGKYGVEEIYGPKKDEFLAEVRKKIGDAISDVGIVLEQFGFIGAPRPPESVVNAINAKITATQQAIQKENEIRTAKADAQKTIEIAKGQAEANRILAQSISQQLIEWRKLEINQKALEKWNGSVPMVQSGSSGSNLLLNVPFDQKK